MDYAIGDVQGCFKTLQALLKKIKFRLDSDRLFLLGDVVNRGKNSLETLEFIYSNKDNIKMVMGNHDFYLLLCALTNKKYNQFDTFGDILQSNNRNILIDYLIQRPLAIEHEKSILVHAGVPPQWSKSDVIKNAKMVQKYLVEENVGKFLKSMFGDSPKEWSENLSDEKKSRYTINALMRMRFCKTNGALEFKHKNFYQPPLKYSPWFLHSNRKMKNQKIFFGHWSTLKDVETENIFPLDHGCIWGGKLSAYNLTKEEITSQRSLEH